LRNEIRRHLRRRRHLHPPHRRDCALRRRQTPRRRRRFGDVRRHQSPDQGRQASRIRRTGFPSHRDDDLVHDPPHRAPVAAALEKTLDELDRLLRGTSLLRELTPRALDAISGIGERLSAPLVAAAITELGIRGVAVSATEVIVSDPHHGRAEPLMAPTRAKAESRLRPLLAQNIVPVVTGFIAATSDGIQTTLGRGGSDYSATILGAALDAQETIIWTDVDGVKTADPRLVPEAQTIPEISYNEAAELAYFGAKVLHPNTLRPVTAAGVPVWIRNSFAPEKPGTKITAHGVPTGGGVKALTAIRDVTLITVGGPGIVGLTDVLARSFAATSATRTNVFLVSQSSSQNDICFVISTADEKRALAALREAFAPEIDEQTVEHVTSNPDIAIVAVVGENMRGAPGVAGRTFTAMGRENINIMAIAQGSSEYNISLVVQESAMQRALTALHHEFRLHESNVDQPLAGSVRG
jgi:aspartate kinase